MSKKNTAETELAEDLNLGMPTSWTSAPLSSVAEFIRNGISCKQNKTGKGIAVSRIETIATGFIDLKRIGYASLEPGQASKYALQPGDILYSHINSLEHLGKTAIFENGNLVHAMNLLCIRPREQIHPYYLVNYLKSENVRDYFRTKCKRAINQVSINTGEVGALSVPLPPLAEQKRIVAKIEATTAKIEIIEKAADEAEKLLQKYRESILAKAFRGELVPQDHSEGTGHDLLARVRSESNEATTSKKKKASASQESADEVSLDIPESWAALTFMEAMQIGCVLDIQDGNHGELHPKASEYTANGIPFVMANNLSGGKIDLANVKYISKQRAERLRIGFAQKNDVLLTHKGTVGEVGVVNELDTDYLMLTPQVTYYRLNLDFMRPGFLANYFRSPTYQRKIKSGAKQATRDYVGITKQKTFPFPVAPLNEQIRIVAAIEKHEAIAEVLQTSINNLKTQAKKLRESILASAFSGKLVPQDPSEGTGHELLEQIRAATTTVPDSEDVTDEAPKKPRKKRTKK